MGRERASPAKSALLRGSRVLERIVARSLRHGTRALYAEPLLYEQLYRRRAHDVAFYLGIARRYGGPVLELGVGTGRVALALARAGISLVGIDSMPAVLARARERILELPARTRAKVELRRGDLRRVRLGRRFRLVIAPFNVFTHLYALDDIERALATCRAHLAPRGRLVFDVAMPELPALLQDPERLYRGRDLTDPSDGQRYAYYEATHYDRLRQIRNTTLLLEQKRAPHARRAIPLTQRQFFPAELEALLHYNGFAIEARYGDFEFGPLDDRSECQVVVARTARR